MGRLDQLRALPESKPVCIQAGELRLLGQKIDKETPDDAFVKIAAGELVDLYETPETEDPNDDDFGDFEDGEI